MFGYMLLLAITKPACDHIIRMKTKNTDAKTAQLCPSTFPARVEDSTLVILNKITTELTRQGKTEEIKSILDSLTERLEENILSTDQFCKQVVLEIHSLHEEIAEVHKLVLENRTAAHQDALSLHNEHVQMYRSPGVQRNLQKM